MERLLVAMAAELRSRAGRKETDGACPFVLSAEYVGYRATPRGRLAGDHDVGRTLADVHVLVIEDEFMVAILVEQLLREWGFRTITSASSVHRALTAINKTLPDIAILDVMLADHASFPAAELLKSKNVPFLFLTALTESAMPPEWQKHTRLEKPFDIEQLKAALDRLLARQS
jgi:CheY-like chemotaxis protein